MHPGMFRLFSSILLNAYDDNLTVPDFPWLSNNFGKEKTLPNPKLDAGFGFQIWGSAVQPRWPTELDNRSLLF